MTHVQTRLKEPFYQNYNLYETEGVDGAPKLGPGAGLWQNMDKYKSVSDFRKKKKKRMRKRKLALLQAIMKIAEEDINNIDFPTDGQINNPIIGEPGYTGAIPIGGRCDYTPEEDVEGKSADKLDFGRYEDQKGFERNLDPEDINSIIEKYLHPKEEPSTEKIPNSGEKGFLGLPNGIKNPEDLDQPVDRTNNYGVTDLGNLSYQKI